MGKSKKAKGRGARRLKPRVAPRGSPSSESKLLALITDPCTAELAHGYALTAEGIVQRFNRFITPAASTETAFAYIFNPLSPNTGITQKLAVGTAAPTTTYTTNPGDAFLDANADQQATLAACIEVLYTGKLVDRKGYIGVCQAPGRVATDIANSTTDLATLLSYCQHVSPVPSHTVELKWSPSIRNFTAQNQQTESATAQLDENCLMVVAIGVNPNDFVVKFTSVYEYSPKFALGIPATRATRTIPPAAGERIVSALDRMGVWWHNLGNAAAAAYRMGGSAVYGIGQVARTARAVRSLTQAVPLLALTG